MSLGSRFSSLLRNTTSNPLVRRLARSLGRSAVRALTQDRKGPAGKGRNTPYSGHDSRGRAGNGAGHDRGGRRGGASAVQEDRSAFALADRRASTPPPLTYAPHRDEHPDPGEVVWARVPFEEDITRGKDRPVLVIAEEDARAGGSDGRGEVLIALMLTSRDRAQTGRSTTDEHGSTWVDIGSGPWDSKGRPSEVRADRLLRIDPQAVRRGGGRLDEKRFRRVAQAVLQTHGW